MIILFIDDQDSRHQVVEAILGKKHTILHSYTYEESIEILESSAKTIGLVMFDCDLGDFREVDGEQIEFNGSKIASYIGYELDQKKYPARAIVHSQNPVGAENLASKLRSAGIHTDILPYSGSMIEKLSDSLAEN